MMDLPDGPKSFPIGLVVLIQYRLWRTPSHPASHVAVAITLNANAKASSLKIDEIWMDRWVWYSNSARRDSSLTTVPTVFTVNRSIQLSINAHAYILAHYTSQSCHKFCYVHVRCAKYIDQQAGGRPPQYARPLQVVLWPFDLKWCPSDVWHGLPLCQF